MLTDEKFMRKVLPFIKPDYFEGAYRTIFREAGKYVAKYNSLPVHEAFKIELDNSDSLSNEQYKVAVEVLPNLFQDDGTDSRWLDDATDPRMTAYIGIAIEDKASDTAGYVEVKVGK